MYSNEYQQIQELRVNDASLVKVRQHAQKNDPTNVILKGGRDILSDAGSFVGFTYITLSYCDKVQKITRNVGYNGSFLMAYIMRYLTCL